MLIGMLCTLAVVVGNPGDERSVPARSANPNHVAHDVAPSMRFADAWESGQSLSRTCKLCEVIPGAAARETLRIILVSAWVVMAAVFILAPIKFPSSAAALRFLGIAGFVVGGTSQFLDPTWQLQLVVFGLSGIVLVLTWSRLDQPSSQTSDGTLNNRHPTSLLGRVFQLQKPIVNGAGMLTIDGTTWRIAGKDCAAGEQVLVARAEGTLLVVNAVAR